MKLKKLEIFGFKSFAEKTEILFEDGVNAIVGPNGCGKSNVVDAVKWVLGEQSARSLRGNEMQDVIFNGTERRPSLGYAEVSLTIINNKGLLPLEYSEVCITRRLYTSGESEYLINKQACRLKDIRTLFMDTGFGSNTYSVIEQGNVDSLLQANAYERRVLFEEAAGISKFKSQKKTALAKLEHVEQNLLRVGDIIEELQKQLRSIKLQAAKARKYQGYTEQLKKLKVGLSLKNYRDLKEHRVAISKERETVEEQKQKLAVIMSDLETRISEYEDETELLDQKMTQLQTESFGIEAQISKSQDKIKYNAERSKELKYRTESLLEQKNGMERKINETKYKLTESEDALRVLEQEISKRENELRTKETSYKQMQLECDMLYQGIEEKKAEVIVILQKESNIQNEIGSLTTGMESLENRKMKLMGRQEEIDNLINRFQTQHQGLMNEKNTLNDEYNCLDRNISEAKGRIQEIITTIRSLEEKVNRQKQQLSSMKSRYEVLMDYEMRAEGVDAGAKFILDEAQRDNSALQGMLGMIADKIKVDLPHALAIEIALGEKVQCIVTGTTEDAIQALSLLQKNQNGNAAFFPLERAQRQETIPEESLKHPNVIDLASNLVNGAEDIREVVDCFLSKTVVVKDLDTALELSRFNSPFRYVTLDGELLEPGGLICGGKRQGQVGIISRRSELDKIEEELSRVQEDIKKLEEEKQKYDNELAGLEEKTAHMTKQTEELNVRKISKDNEILQVEQRKEDLSAEKKINADEIEEINVEKENASERERSLQEKLASYNQQHNELKQKIEEQSRLVEEKEKLTKAFQDEMTSLKVDLAQKQEKRDGLNESLKKLSADQREMQEQMKNIANEYQLCQKKIQDTEKETEYLREKAAELQSQKAVLDESIRNLKSEKEKQEESVADLKAKREEHHTEYTQAEQLLQDTKLKENEYHIRMTNLEERVREEYKLEISEVDASTEEIQLELSKPDESGNTEAGFWDAVSQEIEMLQGKVERLGNVNLEAISEQDELEQREIFLLNQKEDLENSHTTLQNLIKKINHTSRESLEKVFYEIRRNFQAMFRKLFGGGKADIILEENVDILEAGIEIIVQPPNKELRSITLLSGGEKVMVTIALLFAVFQTKPSPFCILDEVDAALDESNINRFQLVIKEFTKDAQFLVITHNKVTMSIADVLYGITMQEPGVSKKVAVKFEEIEKKVA